MDSSINFKANHIKTVKILERRGHKYVPKKAQLVELDRKHPQDLEALRKINDSWENSTYTDKILESMNRKIRSRNRYIHIYALTKQKKDFTQLNPSQILGVMKATDEGDAMYISYVQVKPEYINRSWIDNLVCPAKYKHIGKSLINSLKELFPKKPIDLMAANKTEGFYKKCGFELFSKKYQSGVMSWEPRTKQTRNQTDL